MSKWVQAHQELTEEQRQEASQKLEEVAMLYGERTKKELFIKVDTLKKARILAKNAGLGLEAYLEQLIEKQPIPNDIGAEVKLEEAVT